MEEYMIMLSEMIELSGIKKTVKRPVSLFYTVL